MALTVIFAGFVLFAADFAPPAGDRYAIVTASGSILPGGRIVKPLGIQIETGPRPAALAVSPRGIVATADTGYERFGVTVIEHRKSWQVRHLWARTPNSTAPEIADPDWKQVAAGIAFDGEKSIWVSEGASGRIRQIDTESGDRRKLVSLDNAQWHGSVTAALALDPAHRLLYAVDSANSRIVVIDSRKARVLSSITPGEAPVALALSPDGSTVYAALPNAVCAIDVRNPVTPSIQARTPLNSVRAILAAEDRLFVSNPLDDSITTLATAGLKVLAVIPLRIPALEKLRGIEPAGIAYDPETGWLLAAETGINAVGVVDTRKNQLIGHIPAGWMPTAVAIAGDRAYVANARGRGTGPNLRRPLLQLGEVPTLHRGTVSTFILPEAGELPRETAAVLALNGLAISPRDPAAASPAVLPEAARHVVWIVKENRAFDEVLGDLGSAGNGRAVVAGSPALAIFGMRGRAFGAKTQFSVQDAPITPNQHAIARRWSFSDNFYAPGETRADADAWLAKALDDFRESGVQPLHFHDPSGASTSDQARADRFIAELREKYEKGGAMLPRFLCIRLPNDRTAPPRPQDGYPYAASFVEDNDLATGRILEYLSHSPWWRDMTVLITETDTQGSFDHIDARRTLLLAAGPWVKRGHVSHTNASFPSLLRTTRELLGLPPHDLADATAASLRDLFTAEPDFTPFTAIPPDRRIFDPAKLAPEQ